METRNWDVQIDSNFALNLDSLQSVVRLQNAVRVILAVQKCY